VTWHVGLCSVSSEFRNLLSKDLDDACAQLFIRQRGVLGYGQAIDIGMSKHMIRNRLNAGRWERILPRTYRLVGVPGSFEQHVIAAALWSGGVGSHETAAAVWGLDAARRMRIEITVDGGPSGTPVNWITLHRTNRALEPDRTLRHGIPVTKIPRTLIELGASVPRWRLQAGLDHALRDGFTTPHQLFAELARLGGPGRRGAGRLRRLLEDPDLGLPPPASVLERRIVSRIWGRVPDPVRQFTVFDEEGEVGVLDFAWPDRLVGVEGDSWKHHSKRGDWEHDRRRRNRLTRLGWRILHATWRDCNHPEPFVRALLTFFD
jgi:hypothetical protein